MKTIHSGGQRGLRRPTAAPAPHLPLSLRRGGMSGALGGLSDFCGVQHYTRYPIDFCMMVWYDRASRTQSPGNATMWN